MQLGAGQPRLRGLPRSTALLVVTEVLHNPHMAVHALEDQLEDTGHLVVHQRGGLAWLKEYVTALRSYASTIARAEVRLHDHRAVRPGDTGALSVDQLTPSHPDVRWHSADLNARWLSPTGYYWSLEAWGHTSSDASGGGPCKHATSVALAADLTRTWAVAISGTVPDGESVAASLSLQYGAHWPWVHTVDAEVILHLLRHADCERATGVPAGAAKVVNQMLLRWLQDGLRAMATHRAPFLVCPSHLPPQRCPTTQGGLGGVPGHRPTEHARGPQPRPAHSRRLRRPLRPTSPKDANAPRGRAASTDRPCADAPRRHTPWRGPRCSLCPRPRPHRDGQQPPGAAGQGRPHAGATQAPRPKGVALRRCRPPAAVPPVRRPGGDPGALARGMRPLAAPLAPLPASNARGGPPPPARGRGSMGGLVALRGRRMDRSLLFWAGT